MDLPFETFFYLLGIVLSIKWLYDIIIPIMTPRYGQKPWVGKYGDKKGTQSSKDNAIKLQKIHSHETIVFLHLSLKA